MRLRSATDERASAMAAVRRLRLQEVLLASLAATLIAANFALCLWMLFGTDQ